MFPDAEFASPALKKLYGFTLKSSIELYGEELGQQKWEEYREIQAKTNTFEYKAENHGMSREEFDEYNASRAATLKNFIKRHGIEEGTTKWNNYCERQRYTTSIEYFIEKYGEVEGTTKWQLFYEQRINAARTNISKAERKAGEIMREYGIELDSQFKIFTGKTFIYDFVNHDSKIIIEFQGDYWHMNPKKHDANDIHSKLIVSAETIWNYDRIKKEFAEDKGYHVFYIWESDWKTRNIPSIIANIKDLIESRK